MSHDNRSKNHLIILKFCTGVAFIYCQIEFVVKNQSIKTITTKNISSNEFFFNFRIAFF